MLPSTTDRVPLNTSDEVNQCIRREMEERVFRIARQGDAAIAGRLAELDREWDIERTLEANAASVCIAAVALGTFVDRRFYLLPAAVGAFLLLHALQGWCPPLPVLRRLGVRTQSEIDREKYALKALRGDFRSVHPPIEGDGELEVRDALRAAR